MIFKNKDKIYLEPISECCTFSTVSEISFQRMTK